jgi:hypothetical protein
MPLTRIQSDAIGANQALSLIRVLETANLSTQQPGGNVNIDVSNNTVYIFAQQASANITFNLRSNSSFTFDSGVRTGQTVSVALLVKNAITRYSANLYIDGGLISTSPDLQTTSASIGAGATGNNIVYVGNTKPALTSIALPEVNLFSYTIFKTAANQYTVLAGNTIFGIG